MHEASPEDDALDYLRPASGKRRWAAAVALLLVALLGFGAADRYRAAHVRLWVVNGGAEPLTLDLTPFGVPKLELESGAARLCDVAAGDRVIEVAGEPLELRLAPSFAERWRGRVVYVLNPGGLGAVVWEEARYGPDDEAPPGPRLLHPHTFLRVDDVDIVGEGFPETTGGRRLTRLVFVPGEPQVVVQRLSELDASARLGYLEAHVAWLCAREAPPAYEAETLDAYRRLALELGAGERLRATLRAGLDAGSSLNVHRVYQDVECALGGDRALRAHYAELREQVPDDARLAYLAGRLDPDARGAEASYREAIALDDALAYAHHGLAYLLAARGEFAPAVEAARRAVALAPDQPEFAEVLWLARLGAGEASALLAELQLDPFAPRSASLDAATERRVLELVASYDRPQLGRALAAYAASLGDDAADERLNLALATVAELEADGPGLVAAADALGGGRARHFRLLGLAAEGRLAELDEVLGAEADPWELLHASLAASAASDAPRAERWRSAAAAAFASQGAKGQALGQALAEPPADLDRLPLPLRDGALFFAVLAAAHPGDVERLQAAARRRLLGALAPAPSVRRFVSDR